MANALDITLRVVEIMDELGIPYVLGGSVASSLVGEPRATADVDVAIRLRLDQVTDVVAAFEGEFYVSAEAAREAIRRNSSFNLVHLESIQKIDLFVLGDDPLDRLQMARRIRIRVREDPVREVWVGSVQDQIVRKLRWYDAGGRVSDRQWRDVLGILTVQRGRVDLESLRSVAAEVGMTELLERAIQEAG